MADETVQTEIETAIPASEPAPPADNDHVAPGATPFTEQEIALNSATAASFTANGQPVAAPDIADDQPAPVAEIIDQPTSAPAIDTDSPLFSRFRKLWNGGERRAAVEWAKAMEVAEDEWAALMGEFPELLDIINGN